MPSPFPGMDPYLEDAEWPGVHAGLIVAIQSELNRVLPSGFVARIDEYVWVQDADDESVARVKPDAFVRAPFPSTGPVGGTAVVPLSEPTTRVALPRGRKRKNRAVQIVTAQGRRVVTVIEVLSPSNKREGEDRDSYAAKRRAYLATANLVELDLLRDGDRMPMGKPRPPSTDYYVFVCRADEYPNARVWAFSVRDPLPVVPVPLERGSPDAPLALRACLDSVYDNSRFAGQLDYTAAPIPPLGRLDAEWARDLLAPRKGGT